MFLIYFFCTKESEEKFKKKAEKEREAGEWN